MKVHLRDGAEPFAIHSRSILYVWISRTDGAAAYNSSDRCHPMIVIQKPKGRGRICVDLTKLNEFVRGPSYPLKTSKEGVNRVPRGAKFFTTPDAAHGYRQIPLEEESRHLTTSSLLKETQHFARTNGSLINAMNTSAVDTTPYSTVTNTKNIVGM